MKKNIASKKWLITYLIILLYLFCFDAIGIASIVYSVSADSIEALITGIMILAFMLPITGIILFWLNRRACLIWSEEGCFKWKGLFFGFSGSIRPEETNYIGVNAKTLHIYIGDTENHLHRNCFIELSNNFENRSLLKSVFHVEIYPPNLCYTCKNIRSKPFETKKEYSSVLLNLKQLISNTNYELSDDSHPLDTIENECSPQGLIFHTVKCKECGAFINCYYDTIDEKGILNVTKPSYIQNKFGEKAMTPTSPRKNFITYAHRGASEYCPENTFMSFYMGMQMGANGIETDVQRTRDGVLVLFHDDTLDRVTGVSGSVADYTYAELQSFFVNKDKLQDKIPTFRDFLDHFAFRDITFAIELKVGGIEREVADMIFEYGIEDRTVITSFELDYIKKAKEYAPSLRIGYLTKDIEQPTVDMLSELGAYEICPIGREVTPEKVDAWHKAGLNVRAWGIFNEDIMRAVYDAGADGMTVNFPDALLKYIEDKNNG